MRMNHSKNNNLNAKNTFKEKGTCSRTFAFLLNNEFGNVQEEYERATDPLAGGIMRKGKQCGMLWGSALAIGAESYKRAKDFDKASQLAIKATKKMMESFVKRTHTVNCRDITNCNMDSFFGLTKYMIKVTLQGMNNSKCFNLAQDWAPEAIDAAKKGLNQKISLGKSTINCASLVAKKLGASEEEMVMVSGFAGGMGLSGNGCGALAATIWMNSLAWIKDNLGKSAFGNPKAKATLKRFLNETDSEILCCNICRQDFDSVEEHSEFIELGGCKKLIDILSSN